jgi:hypothetical protein
MRREQKRKINRKRINKPRRNQNILSLASRNGIRKVHRERENV